MPGRIRLGCEVSDAHLGSVLFAALLMPALHPRGNPGGAVRREMLFAVRLALPCVSVALYHANPRRRVGP